MKFLLKFGKKNGPIIPDALGWCSPDLSGSVSDGTLEIVSLSCVEILGSRASGYWSRSQVELNEGEIYGNDVRHPPPYPTLSITHYAMSCSLPNIHACVPECYHGSCFCSLFLVVQPGGKVAYDDLLAFFKASRMVLDFDEIELKSVIGSGAFATVFRGIYRYKIGPRGEGDKKMVGYLILHEEKAPHERSARMLFRRALIQYKRFVE